MDLLVLLCCFIFASHVGTVVSSRGFRRPAADTIQRFPHHVTIHKATEDLDHKHFCSGSIINKKWILSSSGCVRGSTEYRLEFRRAVLNSSNNSFSLDISNNSIYNYPTEYDDICLIKLPVELIFTPGLQPINLYTGYESINNKFAVLAGFPKYSNILRYGMFRIVEKCNSYKDSNAADEYLEICTKPWNRNRGILNENSFGSALIIGWPSRPQLVGIFSRNGGRNFWGVYTKISSYMEWINSIIGDDEQSSTVPPTTELTSPSELTSTTDYSTTVSTVSSTSANDEPSTPPTSERTSTPISTTSTESSSTPPPDESSSTPPADESSSTPPADESSSTTSTDESTIISTPSTEITTEPISTTSTESTSTDETTTLSTPSTEITTEPSTASPTELTSTSSSNELTSTVLDELTDTTLTTEFLTDTTEPVTNTTITTGLPPDAVV